MSAERKRCSKCGEEKPVSEFHRDGRLSDGLRRWCKECCKRQSSGRYARRGTTDKRRETMRTYGLSEATVLELKDRPCDLCGVPPGAAGGRGAHHIDHCHETGAVRGVLCHGCNTGIGSLNDSPELLTRAIHYLTRGADYRAVDREA
jgi:hypothetical protein